MSTSTVSNPSGQDVFLTIGDVTFADFEIPQEINSGTDQLLAIHKQIGGQRFIDAMGVDPRPITWSGRFRGADATTRANLLDQMVQQGLPVELTWYSYSRTVLVKSFDMKFMQFYEVPYTITVEILSNNDVSAPASPNTASDAINGQVADAQDQTTALNVPSITAAMSPISSLALNAGGLANVLTNTATSAISAAYSASGSVFAGAISAIDVGLATTGLPVHVAIGNIGTAPNYSTAFSAMRLQNTLTNLQTNINGD
jgi:hypothetical protein